MGSRLLSLRRASDLAVARLCRAWERKSCEGPATRSRPPRALLRSFASRWVVNCAVTCIVLSLPLVAANSAPTSATSAGPIPLTTENQRATAVSRRGIAAGRDPVTVNAEALPPIVEYTLGQTDTLASLANRFNVSKEAIAFANGITDPNLEVGRTVRIPPGQGALYTVVDGDTVDGVARRFEVDPAVVKDYNRLQFEPEHFAPGKLIFIPGATLPGLVVIAADPTIEAAPSRITSAAPSRAAVPVSDGSFAWPVRPQVTQFYGGGHTGLDIAAPYGRTIVAASAGIVTSAGWVAVGGLRTCIQSGPLEHCYYHTSAVFLSVGQWVERGQPVAAIGLTGVTTGPHVHFEVKRGGTFVNPLSLLR